MRTGETEICKAKLTSRCTGTRQSRKEKNVRKKCTMEEEGETKSNRHKARDSISGVLLVSHDSWRWMFVSSFRSVRRQIATSCLDGNRTTVQLCALDNRYDLQKTSPFLLGLVHKNKETRAVTKKDNTQTTPQEDSRWRALELWL